MSTRQTGGKLLSCLFIVCLIFIFNGFSLGAEKKPYKLGAVFSATGTASFLGDPEKKTTEMLLEQINAAGGINGHPLEVIISDDESDDTKSRILVTKLMKTDLVMGVFGPSTTGTCMSAVDLAEKYGCPIIGFAGAPEVVTDPKTGKERYWVFKIPGNDTKSMEKFYEFMKKKGISKMATLTATTAFGASYRDAAMKLAPTYGISIVADEKFGPKDVDMTVQLTRIKASGAQAIFGCSIGPTQVVILRNWRDLAMTNIPFFQSFGFGTRRNIELAAGAAEGVYTQVSGSTIARILPHTHVQKNVAMEYTIAYESKYNAPVDMFGSCAWDGFMLYVDALKQVGEKYTNLPKLRKAIRDHVEARKGFVGQNGVFNFSPTAHVGLSKDAYSMVIIKGKDFLLVE